MATALACSRLGMTVVISNERRPGAASPAAAGMLAPTTEGAAAGVLEFARACRDAWPAFLASLSELSRIEVELNRFGILELAADGSDAERLRAGCSNESRWLDDAGVAALEPALCAPFGAVHHERDGAVDNEQLLGALDEAIVHAPSIRWVAGTRRVRLERRGAMLELSDGSRVPAGHVILAAGAWVAELEGLPRPVPVVPVRGQMIGFRAIPLRHVVQGPGAYLVPRPEGRVIVGSTMESVGFDAGTTAAGATTLARCAERILPGFAGQAPAEHWSGLRPMTPDLLPIIGPDPEHGQLLYGCGHSRNGILLAPLTATCLAAVAAGQPPPWPLDPFSIGRFS